MSESESITRQGALSPFLILAIFIIMGWYVFLHAAAGHALITPHEQSASAKVTSSDPAAPLPPPTSNTNAAKSIGSPQLPNILPSSVLIRVPFTPQAPSGIWTEPWGEACEEAAIAMAMAWVNGKTSITTGEAENTIRAEIQYENETFGYHRDTTIRETAKIITRYFAYQNIDVIYDVNIKDVKRELAAGNVVLIPTAGALLYNPYFTSPPPYHMLVAVGYDDAAGEFIVHEPGTRHGKNYHYSYATIQVAMHDWAGSEASILTGRTGMIVIHPVTAS